MRYNSNMKKAIIICGPTATGKTKLALQLIKQYPFAMVSADSRQAYKHLDIVVGKDKPKNINILGYDLFETNEKININDYRKKILKLIIKIYNDDNIPLIVGGSGFYIDAIVNPPQTINISPNKKLRGELEKISTPDLYDKLFILNKNIALQLNESDKKNKVRLIRKIEIEKADINLDKADGLFDDVLWIGLTADFDFIREKIKKRVIKRSKLIDHEINFLKNNNLYTNFVKEIVGYKSWEKYLNGNFSKEEAIKEWTRDEINYAKRQITWFKKNKNINWFDIEESDYKNKVEELVDSWHNDNE